MCLSGSPIRSYGSSNLSPVDKFGQVFPARPGDASREMRDEPGAHGDIETIPHEVKVRKEGVSKTVGKQRP